MIRGLYTAASGMQAQQQRNDILTNNLANVNTPGYKSKQGTQRAFPEVLIEAIRVPNSNNVNSSLGTINQGVLIEENISLLKQGDLSETGVNSHMAIYDADLAQNNGIESKLFFTVEDDEGNRYYTRSGLFTEDASGQLVTPEGYMVLDDWGFPIEIDGRSYKIDDKGNMIFSDGEELVVGLTQINDVSLLENIGNQMFDYKGNKDDLRQVEQEGNYTLHQGNIERSNVDVTQNYVDMMSALRMYEANQKVFQSIDQTLDKAVNEVGRV